MPADFGRYAKREYERRWLLRELPAGLDPARPWSLIADHYIDGTRCRLRHRLRLRDNDNVWKLTQKFLAIDGVPDQAVITNTYLSHDEYKTFLRLPGRRLVKQRWLLGEVDAYYGIDVFQEALAGLITAEREFATHELLLASPRKPVGEAIEITDRVEFTGGFLAGKTFADIAGFLNVSRGR